MGIAEGAYHVRVAREQPEARGVGPMHRIGGPELVVNLVEVGMCVWTEQSKSCRHARQFSSLSRNPAGGLSAPEVG